MDQPIASWRRERRKELIAARQTLPSAERKTAADVVAARLDRIVTRLGCTTIGLYWPINNELNLLHWARELTRREGLILCLPVVVTPKAPLEYWRWTPGQAMKPGFWNIPAPEQRDVVPPDMVLAPLVGFDRDKYRLGYGGGYFDRTLAAAEPRPIAIGVGYDFSALETIFPQEHDIRLDAIVTERREILPANWNDHDP